MVKRKDGRERSYSGTSALYTRKGGRGLQSSENASVEIALFEWACKITR